MKNIILLFALSLISLVHIQAQNTIAFVDNDVKLENTKVTSVTVDETRAAVAKFEKVEDVVIQELQSNVKYPAVAYEYNVEGTVLVQFTFDGEVKDAKVIKSVGAGCDKAALKAIQDFSKLYKEMGGEIAGEIQVTIPFVFEM